MKHIAGWPTFIVAANSFRSIGHVSPRSKISRSENPAFGRNLLGESPILRPLRLKVTRRSPGRVTSLIHAAIAACTSERNPQPWVPDWINR